MRVCYARTEPLFDLDAFRRLLADGRKKKPAAAAERPPVDKPRKKKKAPKSPTDLSGAPPLS